MLLVNERMVRFDVRKSSKYLIHEAGEGKMEVVKGMRSHKTNVK